MPPCLVLQFLGLPQLYLEDKPIATDRRKAIALLAYLAVNDIDLAGQRYSRESLSALLWPDYEQAKAFSNLRRTIWEVHQAIGEDWLLAERESVHLNSEAKIDLDVARFQELLSQARQQSDPGRRIPLLSEAVKLYRNHFLTGFSLKDAYPFNEWTYAESEELRRQLAGALTTLSKDYCELSQVEKAMPYARRLVALDPLHEAAHRQLMEVYIQSGQHSASLKQYQTCEQILRKELNLDPQPETQALYKKIRKGEITSVQVEKPREIITPKHNLPLQLSTFVGREKEQDQIRKLLEKNRLVTLGGAGGIGKTRLALQVGQTLLNDYRDGVWFISLDSLSDPALVPPTVASVFGVRERPDRSMIEILVNVLREKITLLILDNCEHLLDSCVQLVTSLLTHCPNLKILATSREILNMNGEAVCFLPSLSIPEDNKLLAEQLTEYESVQLFTERAMLAQPSFELTQENAATVVNICSKLDGIPLAIELAAARVNILNVEEIFRQLHNSFSLLSNNRRSTLQRHQTLRASMNWSWGLLSEEEQRFMRQLSVFAGGWTLESAQAICEDDVLNLTSALVKKSLIMVNHESEYETRYRFHEIVRQYAREKLTVSVEEANISTRHLKYFLQLSEQAEFQLRSAEQVKWFSRIFDERDNIRAALIWAGKTDDVETGLYISGRLDRFWDSSDLREGARWLDEFLRKPESKAYPLARAKALFTQGRLLTWLGQSDQARSAAQECLDLYRACDNKEGEVEGLLLLGYILEGPKGVELSLQALALAQALDDIWRQARALANLGWIDSRDFTGRIGYWEKAIPLFRKAGDLRWLAALLGSLGFYLALNGDIEPAQKCLDEATLLLQQLNRQNLVSNNARYGYAQIALMRGDYERARALLQETAAVNKESGNWLDYVWARVRLGYVALREGNVIEARDMLTEAALEFQKDANIIGVVFALEGIASLYATLGKPERAARLIGWADTMRKEIKDTRPLFEQADVDKIIAACLAKMSEVAFSDAYDEGQKMSLDDTVAYALEEG